MPKREEWCCIKQCGACCKLDPYERVEAIQVLSEQDKELYLSMVGPDGWCKFYEKSLKICTIYNQRPSFCKVKNISSTFDLSTEDTNEFTIRCCKEHIKDIYGPRSKVMKKFKYSIRN